MKYSKRAFFMFDHIVWPLLVPVLPLKGITIDNPGFRGFLVLCFRLLDKYLIQFFVSFYLERPIGLKITICRCNPLQATNISHQTFE